MGRWRPTFVELILLGLSRCASTGHLVQLDKKVV